MKKHLFATIMILATLAALLAGCAQPTAAPAEPTAAPAAPSGGAALAITGLVDSEQSLTLADLQGMDVVEITATPPHKTEAQTFQGVRLSDLLALAQPQASATTLTFTASDDYSADIPLADVQACADCMVSFNDEGGLSMTMPNMPGNSWVKNVISIELK